MSRRGQCSRAAAVAVVAAASCQGRLAASLTESLQLLSLSNGIVVF
jgi:hypothetical protein